MTGDPFCPCNCGGWLGQCRGRASCSRCDELLDRAEFARLDHDVTRGYRQHAEQRAAELESENARLRAKCRKLGLRLAIEYLDSKLRGRNAFGAAFDQACNDRIHERYDRAWRMLEESWEEA